MRIALVTVFVFALFIFAWARWHLPTRGHRAIDEWKERAWDINPRIFYLGMRAMYEYRPASATGSFLVSGLAFFALVVLQYLGK